MYVGGSIRSLVWPIARPNVAPSLHAEAPDETVGPMIVRTRCPKQAE